MKIIGLIKDFEKQEFEIHMRICHYLLKLITNIFQKIDTEKERIKFQHFRTVLYLHEENIIECFQRAYVYH